MQILIKPNNPVNIAQNLVLDMNHFNPHINVNRNGNAPIIIKVLKSIHSPQVTVPVRAHALSMDEVP